MMVAIYKACARPTRKNGVRIVANPPMPLRPLRLMLMLQHRPSLPPHHSITAAGDKRNERKASEPATNLVWRFGGSTVCSCPPAQCCWFFFNSLDVSHHDSLHFFRFCVVLSVCCLFLVSLAEDTWLFPF